MPSSHTVSPLARVARWSLLCVLVLAFIVVPFVLFEQEITAWSESLLATTGSRWLVSSSVVGLLALDVALPIPSSLVAAFAISLLGAPLGGVLVWVGLSAAAWLGYGIGRVGGASLATRIAGTEEYERAARMMERRGPWVLSVCRGVPVLAEASTLFAGAVRQPPISFAIATALGNLGVAGAYALVGFFTLPSGMDLLLTFALGLVVPGAFLLLFRGLGLREQQR